MTKRNLIGLSMLAGTTLFMSGCLGQYYAEKKYQENETIRLTEKAELDQKVLNTKRERDVNMLQYEYDLAALGEQGKTLNIQHTAARKADIEDIELASKIDAGLLTLGGFFLGGIPGGAGLLAGIKRYRKGWQEGEETTAVTLRDAIREARAADPAFDAAFDGLAGEVLKTELPEAILEYIKADSQHKPIAKRVEVTA